MLKITILGCGSSVGVPAIGCNCKVCNSSSPYNKRDRSAIIIHGLDTTVLVDFGFEIRHQLIRAKIKNLDAVILTHDHADHSSGIDDLRVFRYINNKVLDFYTDNETGYAIKTRYGYLFERNFLSLKLIDFYSKIKIKNLNLQFFKQSHGVDSLGIRIGNFVYSNDLIDFPNESKQFLQNIEIWVLDCIDYVSNNIHSGLDKILEFQKEYKPKEIFLTNLSHSIDYHKIINELPKNIKPLYDGYIINVPL